MSTETLTAQPPPAARAAVRRLDVALTTPAAAAARYRSASEQCRALARVADFDGCLAAQDEMAMCRCQLAAAGRLDLIGGES